MFYYYIITTNYFKCHYFKIGITSNYYHYYHYYVLLSGATWRCTTSYVLTCISYVHAYNIAYDIAYDIVCDVHSIGFGAGFRGFKFQIACTIAQAQEFAWQCIHSGIDRPTSGRRSRAIAAALGSGGRGSRRRGSSISGGRGSRFLVLFIPRHGEALGVNGFACGNVHNIPFSTVNILVIRRRH
jgi:hypothetical protein